MPTERQYVLTGYINKIKYLKLIDIDKCQANKLDVLKNILIRQHLENASFNPLDNSMAVIHHKLYTSKMSAPYNLFNKSK